MDTFGAEGETQFESVIRIRIICFDYYEPPARSILLLTAHEGGELLEADMSGLFTPLDTTGAADYTGVSRSSLEKLRVYGGGPLYLKLGRRVRYRVEDLERWLSQSLVSSTSAKLPTSFDPVAGDAK